MSVPRALTTMTEFKLATGKLRLAVQGDRAGNTLVGGVDDTTEDRRLVVRVPTRSGSLPSTTSTGAPARSTPGPTSSTHRYPAGGMSGPAPQVLVRTVMFTVTKLLTKPPASVAVYVNDSLAAPSPPSLSYKIEPFACTVAVP